MPTTIDEAGDLIRQQVARTEAAPQSLPTFPVLGPGRMIEPGVMLHEVNLGPLNTSVDSLQAAQGGRLWVYLPSASAGATDHKLPCVLMTAAGTNLLSGIELSEADQRVAHLPFARAGFAVVAFELDGSVAENAPSRVLNEAGYRFLRARAGLANAHVAFEYTRQMIPAIDPTRISIAGHSSAGVVALLFAATEPKLRSAVAFAPAVDIEARFGPAAVATVQRSGFGDLAVRYSPTNYCQKLLCPVFLFAARDDSNTPFREAETFANRFRNRGEPLTFDTVNKGDHYQSMVDQGIPHAIAWLRGRPIPADDSLVVRPTSRPAQTLTPPGPTPQPGQSTSLDQAIAGRTKAQQDRVRAQIEAMRQRQDEIRNRMRNRTRP